MILSLTLLALTVTSHDAPSKDDPKVDGNHFAEEAKKLQAKIEQEGKDILGYQQQIKDLEGARKQLRDNLTRAQQVDDPDFRATLVADAHKKLADNQKQHDDTEGKLKTSVNQQAEDYRNYRLNYQAKMGLYHVNNYDDFHKAEWVQPWFVPSGTEVWRIDHLLTGKTSAVVSPLDESEITSYQEAARLHKTSADGNLFEVDERSSSKIRKIVVSDGMTIPGIGDEYITVIFKNGGEIRYKQPRDRMRADHDMWVRTYDWLFASPHKPAAGMSAKDYPDEILLMRPKAEGDAAKPDADLTYIDGWETAARTTGIIGAAVLAIVGFGALVLTGMADLVLFIVSITSGGVYGGGKVAGKW